MNTLALSRVALRFQTWVVIAILGLSVLLVAAFMGALWIQSSQVAERSAQVRFSEVSRQAAHELQERVKTSGLLVKSLARSSMDTFILPGEAPATTLVPVFLSALEGDVATYAHYFALANGDFVQAIGVRRDARVVHALQAPADTEYAIRVITRNAQGSRVEQWQFLNVARQLLGKRQQPASYDPLGRIWYTQALSHPDTVMAPPYVFASNHELGLTVAHALPAQRGVLATDISLRSLAGLLAGLPLTDRGVVLVMDSTHRILAFSGRGERYQGLDIAPLAELASVGSPYIRPLRQMRERADPVGQVQASIEEVEGERLVYTDYVFEPVPGHPFHVVAFAPMSEFNGDARAALRDMALTLVFLLLVLLPLAAWVARRMSRQLGRLTRQAEDIQHLNFQGGAVSVQSRVKELNTLAQAQGVMRDAVLARTLELGREKDKLARLVKTGLDLAREQNREALLRTILFGGRDLAPCQAATLFLRTPNNTLRFTQRTLDDELPAFELHLYDPATGRPNDHYMATYAALYNKPVVIDDVYTETRFDMSGTKRFSAESGFKAVSLLTMPLSPRDGEVIGVLQFVNAIDPQTGALTTFNPDLVGFLQAMATQAAVALDNQNLLAAQKDLMDALIKLIAGAIDAKSPYTGGHCERVPELAAMLAQEATQVQSGPLAAFGFHNEDEWREFHIGSWLHDCGKVTTPEYVVDKATKLETLYNRIHEVRMRFEVLWRDADIERLHAVARGQDVAQAQAAFEARCQQLQDDFAFVAECNLGGEFMSPERMARIRAMAETPWLRHFDDRLGLSHEELRRCPPLSQPLPVVETLLADRPQHRLPRPGGRGYDPKYGIQVQVPQDLYNLGEVYNLCVSRGTLTEEERFKINEHVIQTLMMLDRLPWPAHLRRVPEYAATHHETLAGTGYPRRLRAEQLSVPARIMAIADIFEALTASDRPYKKAKTLSESIKILYQFKKDRHIDPDLFDLFLRSGVYLRYAQRYLSPEQIDPVDIQPYLG